MESTIVIKVKHEETLRRFNARIVNRELDLNLDGLRDRIIGLFKFTPDAELKLTYIDEDGDIVTLGDDEDLRDVGRQALNPLRITVKLSIEKNGSYSARTSGISLISPRVQQPSQNLNSNVLLKSVLEPIRQTITKICTDLASTGVPSGQTFTDLLQCFSEMGLPYLNQLSDLPAGANISKQDGASGCTTNILASSQDAEGSKGDAAASAVLPSAGSEKPSSKGKDVFQNTESKGSGTKNEEENSINSSGGVKALAGQFPGLEVVKAALDSANPNPPRTIEIDASKKKEVDYQSGEQLPIWNAVHFSPLNVPVSNTVTVDSKEASDKPKESTGTKSINPHAFPSYPAKSINAHAFPSYPANAIWYNPSSQMIRDSIGGAKNVFQTGLGNCSSSNVTNEIDASKKKEVDYQSGEQLPIWNAVHFSPLSVSVSNTVTGDSKEASDKPKESTGTKSVNPHAFLSYPANSINAHSFPSYPANAIYYNPGSQMIRDSIGGAKNVFQTGLGNCSGSTVTNEIDASKKKEVDYQSGEQFPIWNAVHFSPPSVPVSNTVTGDNKEASDKPKESTGTKSINAHAFPSYPAKSINAHAFPSYPANAIWCKSSSQMIRDSIGGAKNVFQTGLGNSSGSNLISPSEIPFTELPLGNSPAVAPQLPSQVVQPRRSHGLADNSGIVFHRGVGCDGCGVHPITGPLFKSKVKDDYDLCSICFAQMGNESDYIRLDRPVAYRHPYSFKGLYGLHNRVHTPPQPPVIRCGGVKPGRPKIDSRFIQDVNVLDGTIMAPSTPFTKIWRMRNNGSVVWPQGTQLVWTGGDKLSDISSVDIEIASAGFPVDQELDIAVDFVAPDRPGRYISYWRMASSSGQKFGQRVWVLIQVDASSKQLLHEGFRGFNLNLPPVSNGISGPEIISVKPEPVVVDGLSEVNNSIVVDSLPEVNNSNGGMQLVEPVVDALPEKEQEVNFPIDDTLLVGGGAISSPVPVDHASLGFCPIIDLSEVALPEPCASLATVVETSAQDVKEQVDESLLKDVEEESEVEETLKYLEEIGFKHVDLNKEILRSNEYDLEKSIDELCGVAEDWDPILEELREMGFCDKAMNHKLLKKNNGSIKRVVMDHLAGEQ